jgi:hypothetical protein
MLPSLDGLGVGLLLKHIILSSKFKKRIAYKIIYIISLRINL